MLKKWKLRMARRDLSLALQYEQQCHQEIQDLRNSVLPGLESRVRAAELALMYDDRHQDALADPRTPAEQSRRLVEIAIQRKQQLLAR